MTADLREDTRGFTLVELLVVVAIIAVLAALLAPVYAQTKRAAWRAQCQSNLAQIAKAFEGYLADNNGCYPNTDDPYLWMGRHWRWPMKSYVAYGAVYDADDIDGANQITHRTNTILSCPADPTNAETWDRTSYGYSAAFYHTPDQINSMTTAQLYSSPTPPCVTVRSCMVKYPSKKAVMADWLSHSDERADWWDWRGERNYLFVDGHVRFLKAKNILPAKSPDESVARTAYPDINLTTNGVAGKDID